MSYRSLYIAKIIMIILYYNLIKITMSKQPKLYDGPCCKNINRLRIGINLLFINIYTLQSRNIEQRSFIKFRTINILHLVSYRRKLNVHCFFSVQANEQYSKTRYKYNVLLYIIKDFYVIKDVLRKFILIFYTISNIVKLLFPLFIKLIKKLPLSYYENTYINNIYRIDITVFIYV